MSWSIFYCQTSGVKISLSNIWSKFKQFSAAVTLHHYTIILMKHTLKKKKICILLSIAYLWEQANFVKTKQGFACHRRLILKIVQLHRSVYTLFHQQTIEKYHQPICRRFVGSRELAFKGKERKWKEIILQITQNHVCFHSAFKSASWGESKDI